MDFKDNKVHFSKIIIILCIIFAIVCCTVAVLIPMADTIAIALITAGGGLASTAIIFNLKKSQAENSVKIYVGAYKIIMKLRQKYGLENDELCDRIENSVLQNLDDVAESHMDNANEIIEKVEVNI